MSRVVDEVYVRFESSEPDRFGRRVGVFALLNTMARQGRLSPEQERFRRANNDWYDGNLPDPARVDPLVYDPRTNPGAVAWFKSTAESFISPVDGCLAILASLGVGCVRRTSIAPGRILYEDDYQVVVVEDLRRPSVDATTP